MTRAQGLVIHWVPYSQRSATLAERLGYQLHLLKRAGYRRPWTALLTYPVLVWNTLVLLVRYRPRSVIVIAPPFVAPLSVVLAASILRTRVVIDVHTGALVDRRWQWSIPILAWAARRAGLALVTLPSLADELRRRGVDTLVFPDPLPRLPQRASDAGPAEGQTVVAVCGWGDDEPVDDLLEAAAGQTWEVYLTGAPPRPLDHAPANVHITGFLDREAYAELLSSADVVVVLTRRDDTLLSGAWEALALGRPLVVSGTPALVTAFGPIIASAGPTPLAIRDALASALADPSREALSRAVAAQFERASDEAVDHLRARLGNGRRRKAARRQAGGT